MSGSRFTSRLVLRFLLLWALVIAAVALGGCGAEQTSLSQTGLQASTETTATGTGGSTAVASVAFRADPARTGVYPGGGPTQQPQLLWKFRTDTNSCPTVADGVVYAGGTDGFYAIDAQSGEQKWKSDTGQVVDSSPAVAEGLVYVGGQDGSLHALDVTTGHERWKFQTAAYLYCSPVVANGVVYFGTTSDGYLYALDSATGEEKWKFKTDGSLVGDPSVSAGTVYVGCRDLAGSLGYLYALDAQNGQEKWSFKGGGIVSCPAVVDGTVYVTSMESTLYALDGATGEVKWTFGSEDRQAGGAAVSSGVVYVSGMTGNAYDGGDGYLYALDSQTGQEKWELKTDPGLIYVSCPSVSDGLVYFGARHHIAPVRVRAFTPESVVYAVDANGQKRWAFSVPMEGLSAPSIADGVLYMLANRDAPFSTTTTAGGPTSDEAGDYGTYVYALK